MIQDSEVQKYSALEILRDIHEWMKNNNQSYGNGGEVWQKHVPVWEWNNQRHNILYLLETFSSDLDDIGDLGQIEKRINND